MKLKTTALPLLALGVAATFLGPAEDADGYVILFSSGLGTSQRDVRLYNNFADASANNNQTPHAQFPGYQGADMAVWKAVVEWGSELHGNGTGDPHQGNQLGSGGANFDASWQGNATSAGSLNSNIFSVLSQDGGGVYAYIQNPGSDGWTGKFYESPWNWQDGPGSTSTTDIQGIACHEYGHSLGLGHSSNTSATMYYATSPGTSDNERSIASDDINGIKAIYGAKSATKPRITGLNVNGSTVTVTGNNFSSSGNEVWFTQKNAGGTGTPIKVTNVNSSSGSITVTIPASAGSGDVLVKKNASGHSSLSNAWPIDVTSVAPPGLSINGVAPLSVEAVVVDGPQIITISGSGFLAVQTLHVNGVEIPSFPAQFVVVNDNTIELNMPQVSQLGLIPLEISDGVDSASAFINVVPCSQPTLDIVNSDPALLFSATGVTIRMGGTIGSFHILWVSPDLSPSVLPGYVDLDIGNNFSTLFLLTTAGIPNQGYAELHYFIPPTVKPGTMVKWQAAELLLDWPTVATNVQGTTFLF